MHVCGPRWTNKLYLFIYIVDCENARQCNKVNNYYSLLTIISLLPCKHHIFCLDFEH